jgi:membrane-bound lytic murein transglycosylase A
MFKRFILGIIVLLAAGCALFPKLPAKPGTGLIRLSVQDYPDFSDGLFLDNLTYGIGKSLEYLDKLPVERTFRFGADTYSALHLIRSLETLRDFVETGPGPAAVNRFIADRYRVYRSSGGPGSGQVLFTGYYEPHLKGSLTPDARFRYPVHAMPTDLMVIDLSPFAEDLKGKRIVGRLQGKTLVPYPDRQAIEADDGFVQKAPPIAWVDDRIELFFLQIQGSGRIYLNTGGFIRVHYHGANGRPYRSIGRLLIDQGKIPAKEMSMQRLKAYLHDHPPRWTRCSTTTPAMSFSRPKPPGPIGAIGVDLTPGRSVAVDRRVFPMAAPAFLRPKFRWWTATAALTAGWIFRPLPSTRTPVGPSAGRAGWTSSGATAPMRRSSPATCSTKDRFTCWCWLPRVNNPCSHTN